ncbi:MAG: hypothetical protein H7226_04200 [Salinibacterium sp.]|nr:hypothetical protein [Salinibacterium sp.]
MHSWRDVLSVSARTDVDRMLSAALSMAKQQLSGSSEFDPFALVTDIDGRLLAADVDLTGLGRHPESDKIADAATARLRMLAPTARASALTVNTRLSERRTDAVEVRLEHREGAALMVFLPYKRPRFGGAIDFGELMQSPGAREIWT